MSYTIEQTNKDVVTLRHGGVSADWSQRYLLLADVHFDSPHSNRRLLRSLLQQAQETGAGVMCFGDWFDAMQGRVDKRSAKSSLMVQYKEDNYLDRIVDDSVSFLEPYRSNLVMLADGNHECYDQQTEVLTNSGWKLFNDLDRTELVATLNLETKTVEWQQPTAYHVSHFTGQLHQVKCRGANFVVTPNHRIVMKRQVYGGGWSEDYIVKRSEELSYSAGSTLKIPVSGKSGNAEYPGVSDLELQLLGWVLTDGNMGRFDRTNRIQIYQRTAKLHLITNILDALGFNYRLQSRTRTTDAIQGVELKEKVSDQHTITLQNSSRDRVWELLEGEKRIPSWMQQLSDRQFEIFLSSFIDGDGSRHPSAESSWMAYGARPMLEQLQVLCVTHGFKASLATYRERESRLNITRHYDYSIKGVGAWFSLVNYDAPVYCVTVPNGTLFVRRNGYVCISGNSAIKKYMETDLLERVCKDLGAVHMGYSGFVRFLFSRNHERGRNSGGNTSRVMFFHHGSGGGGEVTKGVVRAQRQSAWVGDADIFVGGHVHEQWALWGERLRLGAQGNIYRDTVLHLCLPTIKDEFELGGGFHVEKGRPPKPQGAYWLEFRHARSEHGRVEFDVARASG